MNKILSAIKLTIKKKNFISVDENFFLKVRCIKKTFFLEENSDKLAIIQCGCQ